MKDASFYLFIYINSNPKFGNEKNKTKKKQTFVPFIIIIIIIFGIANFPRTHSIDRYLYQVDLKQQVNI